MIGISTRPLLPTAIQGVSRRRDPLTTSGPSASLMSPGQSIRNRGSAIVLSVLREIEIWRVAALMVSRYAGEAEANSFRRAEESAAEGDHAGAAIWRRITVAVEQLTDTTGLV